jgi:hypothetical protein
VSFAAITLRRVIPKVSVYFVIDSVRKLLDTPSYNGESKWWSCGESIEIPSEDFTTVLTYQKFRLNIL